MRKFEHDVSDHDRKRRRSGHKNGAPVDGDCDAPGCDKKASKLIHASMISEDCFWRCLVAKYGREMAKDIFKNGTDSGHVIKNGTKYIAKFII